MHTQDTASKEPVHERVVAGRYRLLSTLGKGGMGTVWRAHDEVLQREVAVKEVHPLVGQPDADSEMMYTRLEREAWAAARITSRNVVTVYDVARDEGRPWIVMEFVRGQSLAQLLDVQGALEPRRAAKIGSEILAALRDAHSAGVLHRDVKPANVLLAEDGRVVLTDFGIAVVEGSTSLTMPGVIVGSPEYMAPERLLGRAMGPESDLWSLGVLLHTAVEGSCPFRRDTAIGTLQAVIDEESPVSHRSGPLKPVIEALLHKDPAERADAESTAKGLNIVAGGGTVQVSAESDASYTPTVAVVPPTQTDIHAPAVVSHAPTVVSPAAALSAEAPQPRRAWRTRRMVLLAASSAFACAVLLAGLGYALSGDDSNEATVGAASGVGAPPQSDGGGTASVGEDADQNLPAAATVSAAVSARNTHYKGQCPPPSAQAPTFTVTLTVSEVPAQVTYRWVSSDGSVDDPQWRTVSFPAGGPSTRQETARVTSSAETGSSEMGVEIQGSQQIKSDTIPFSLTCTPAV
ncbi:serine/threonine-protein kinase [Streptomyces sp. IB201691-2A2]|uniref:serine/threonine-protein kinase n=1 Tax=Streptomyces sp. IB201691-2A2 TaxID=2561920 RepID=UPI00117EDB10|nr:serine/threonine-protein kinase [Streptomyces sp. IB201691-2A2]TRO55830.1 serine/threonine protein kinase [Streptomyces sp. IB201691-2A2]